MKSFVLRFYFCALLCFFSGLAQLPAGLPTEPLGPSSRRTGVVFTEIHYHPGTRSDVRNLEFIELYNSNPFIEDISNWHLDGDIQFTFPTNTVLGPNAFLVVAAAPADLIAVYGVTNAVGPFTNSLPNKSGRVKLVKKSGGIVLDLTYNDQPPWPLAADGYGPSMVLVRPTYGEADGLAWAASARVGGSPGVAEPFIDPADVLTLNEVLVRPHSGNEGFVEIHNSGTHSIDISGFWLGVASKTNRFQVPAPSVVAAGGFASFTWTQLGWMPEVTGDRITLANVEGSHYIDVIQLEGQAWGVSVGRQPDGSQRLRPLRVATPAAANADVRLGSVVINEILHHPPLDVPESEFVELFNRQNFAVDISGWRFTSGIDYTFPSNTWMPAKGYVVVARNPERLGAYQGGFASGVLFGPYQGGLSSHGERLAIASPDRVLVGESLAHFWTVVDEVSYESAGRWGRWSDGGGSSLELIQARTDHNQPQSWADSDERSKSDWQTIEDTGLLDLPHPSSFSADQLHIMLFGAGEALVDNVEVLLNGQNRIQNPQFETNTLGWAGQGTHRNMSWDTNGGFGGGRALRIVASDRGDHVANRVRGRITPVIPINSVVTIRAKARWVRGNPDILFRLRSGTMEAAARLKVPTRLGTPGRVNSQNRDNVGPAIFDVQHFPTLPQTNNPIRVTARVSDPEGVTNVLLRYRIDPTNTLFDVRMTDDGAGADAVAGDHIYTAQIPAQKSGKLVAFRVEAFDKHVVPLRSVFPDAAPLRECLVRVGEKPLKGNYGTYRMWVTQSNLNYWTNREKMSNEEIDATFIYGTNRVVYNVSTRYAGSYYTVPTYDSPIGSPCGYDIVFPKDQLMLGEDHFTLDWPIRDDTDQKEQLMFWFCEQLGLPNMYRRYVNMVVNGNLRAAIYDDVQQPDGGTIREFFPNDADGDLVKTDCWDEFDDTGNPVGGQACVLNTMQNFITPTGEKKVARYRWNWRPRAVKRSAHDFSSFFSLIDAVNAPGSNAFVNAIMAQVDIDNWMRTFAMNDLASYWDGFGNPNSKNTYLYKPQNAGWKLYSWDFDVGLGTFGDPTDAPLFDNIGDPGINRIYATPTLVRPYWEALYESLSTFFITGKGTPIETLLDSKYAGFKTNSIALNDPSSIKTWIKDRRTFLLSELKKVNAPFAISTNKIASYTNEQGVILLTGTAPPSVHTLLLNGRSYPAKWTSATNWVVEVTLNSGTNTLSLEGRDRYGLQPTNAPSSTVQLFVPLAPEPPRGQVVINEILFQSAIPGTEFVEIYNRSTKTTYDLSGWRLEGVSFVFPPGSVIRPGGFLVVVGDERVFGDAYGWSMAIAGEFPGRFNAMGESLRLVRPGEGSEPDTLVDSVTYSIESPWPLLNEDVGQSLELVDASRDRRRVGNWDATHGAVSGELYSLLPLNAAWRYLETGVDPGAGWPSLGFSDADWSVGAGIFWNSTNVLLLPKGSAVRNTNSVTGASVITHYFRTPVVLPWNPGIAELRLGIALDDGGVFYVNGQEVLRRRVPLGLVGNKTTASTQVLNATLDNAAILTVTNLHAGTNIIAVEVHQFATTNNDVVFGLELTLRPLPSSGATPGAPNRATRQLPAFPDLWLSEVQAENITGPVDASAKRSGWVELYNSGAIPIDLSGMFLSANPGQLDAWRFPAGSVLVGGKFGLVWMDGQGGATPDPEWHAGFLLPANDGIVLLSRIVAGRFEVLDYLSYHGLAADESFGKYPSDNPEKPQGFAYPTPRGINDNTPKPVTLWINEWMASNASSLADPLDGNFDDWFEIYNPSTASVDISGFTLTDSLSQPTQFKIPNGFSVPARGYLLVWADNQPGQNLLGVDLHTNFKLSGSGEAIGLFAKDGRRIDAVVFKSQTNDISQGRQTDGAPSPFVFFHRPTPRSKNIADTDVPAVVEILEVFRDEPGAVVVKWRSETGRQYRLMAKDELNDAVWRGVGGVVRATSALSLQVDIGAVGASHRFYRIEAVP